MYKGHATIPFLGKITAEWWEFPCWGTERVTTGETIVHLGSLSLIWTPRNVPLKYLSPHRRPA